MPDKDLTDTEQIPMCYNGGIKAFFKKEVLPYASDAWIDNQQHTIQRQVGDILDKTFKTAESILSKLLPENYKSFLQIKNLLVVEI